MLSVSDLQVVYDQRVRAVQGVSFAVPEGEIVGIIGPNGAGKTSILNAISGAVRPERGRVMLDGADITGWPPHRTAAAGLGHVPEGRHILGKMTVRENLEMGAFLRTDRAAVQADIEHWMGRFPILGQRQRTSAGQLSGGEQQMLALARALMGRPRILLLDEPSMGLAPKIVNEIFEVLAEMKAGGLTILIVEQNAKKVLQYAGYTYVLERGTVAVEGLSAELAQDPRVIQAYLGV